jgi:hypothetical protein
MVVALIENPKGVEIVDQIAAVPGIDVVFVASTDLGSFSQMKQGDAAYEALVTKVRDATTRAGLKVGGPLAWKDVREGYSFFQGTARGRADPVRSARRARHHPERLPWPRHRDDRGREAGR